MKKEDISELLAILETPKKIAIIPHRSPDGDAMGATLALYHLMLKLNQQPTVIAPNNFPEFLSWLPTSDKVLIFENDKSNVAKVLKDAEIVFTLDFNALHRVGEMEQTLNKLNVPFVMIDHHQNPDNFAKFTYSDTSFGSTCEMIYNFIGQLGYHHLIDKDIANCIYTGILTDSGSFRFPKTTGTTHRIVANLIELGAENTEIPNRLFENNSFDRLKLLGCAFSNMKIVFEKNTAYITLSQKELDQNNYQKGDTEGFVNYGLTIKGIIFAAIFIENKAENMIKISFRSQGNFDVNEFARKYFDGGGHINAAGGKSVLSMEETVLKFNNIIQDIDIK
jgi:phosphoesterase RecJ-like protein